ncbi:hypothetical protein HZH68_010723 [Vespula germanica]|uniref:Uncharacterized protein n=1 Tax=Vespula germanica TaxID=30212 RepID=A0A834N3S0_VESGE|nr:hypothetical protein HZH68_010723 [Vespula germanica]
MGRKSTDRSREGERPHTTNRETTKCYHKDAATTANPTANPTAAATATATATAATTAIATAAAVAVHFE